MLRQLQYFRADLIRLLGKRKIRIIHIWMSRVFWGVLIYRFERGLFLTFPRFYGIIRVPFIPLFNLIYAYSNMEINYHADIKGGLLVLHPSAGIVVSGQVIAGKNLTLTGGNIIGAKAKCPKGTFVIGDNCSFGANAVVIGPVILGNDINIGAGAVVVKTCKVDGCTLVGVPAKTIQIQ